MVYVVKWTENGKKKSLTVELHEIAIMLLNRIIVDCKHYDATLVEYPSRY